MNSLSWLILLIGVVEKASGTILFILVVSVLVAGLSGIATIMSLTDQKDYGRGPEAIDFFVRKILKSSIITFSVAILLNAVMVDKEYLIMIAASEVGERVMTSETAQKMGQQVTGLSGDATDLLRVYIQNETKKIEKEMIDSIPKDK